MTGLRKLRKKLRKMAEFKTYTCDRCKKQNAIRLTFPSVDTQIDSPSGKTEDIEGHVDLCQEHLERFIIKAFVNQLNLNTQSQRLVWRYLLGAL